MILTVQRLVHTAVSDAVHRLFPDVQVPPFNVEVPPNRALGDLAVTVAFQLARPLRKAPRAIAQELAAALGTLPGITRIVVAPNGYLNLSLDRPAFLRPRVRGEVAALAVPPEKTVVEHTAINPNKAAHIGHLRNAALGDTLARVLRYRGTPVEVQNYIDDTGVQVADVIVGFRELEHRSVDEVRQIAESTRFDYYCWDLYSRVTEWYDEDAAHLGIRAAALHDLEHGGNEVAEMGAVIVNRIVRAHLQTMARLNVSYDLLTYEGDILRLKFWAHAFDILKAQGAVFLQTEGKLAGCWVMRIEDDGQAEAEDGAANEEGGPDNREKVIVRSNGVVTYVGKDIANQFWKFGLLGRDFRYKPFMTQQTGQVLWATTSGETDPSAPPFGNASRIFNVIDSRQMYLQALLSQALRTLGHPREAENSIHFSYEMVALSHATARELGYPDESTDSRKPFVEVSGRKGLGVKVDDMLDLLTEKASTEVAARNPEFSSGECRRVAAQIAVAAIRYFMLKFSRGKLIVFDIEEALSFEGETGPYLQYAAVRAQNILNKLKEREGLTDADVRAALDRLSPDELMGADDAHGLWAVVLEASRLDEVVDQVVRALEFSGLAKYTFGLAQLFSAFYHKYPIVNEEDRDRKLWRAAGVAYFRDQLTRALDLMG
ncbi:MAG: arginine--tRNA ligase, partial [Vicinamibacterales bacterium]